MRRRLACVVWMAAGMSCWGLVLVPKFKAEVLAPVPHPQSRLSVDAEVNEEAPSESLRPVLPEPGLALRVAPECDHEVVVFVRNQGYRVGMLHHRWRVVVASREICVAKKIYRVSAAFSPQNTILDVWSDPAAFWPSELNEACRGLGLEAFRPGIRPAGDPQNILFEMIRAFMDHQATGEIAQKVRHQSVHTDTWTGATP